MERMGISAWSTGSPRQEAEPSVSIKRRTLSFSISMYLEMTRIMSDQPYEFRRTACLICHKEKLQPEFGRIFGTSGLHVVSPLLCPLQHPGQPYKKASGLAGGFDGDILP